MIIGNRKLIFNMSYMTSGMVVRAIIQSVYFVILVRVLGPNDYGTLVSVIAFCSIFASISGGGGGFLLIKNLNQKKQKIQVLWANAVKKLIVIGFGLTSLNIIVLFIIFKELVGIKIILILCIHELMIQPGIELCAQLFQAINDVKTSSIIYVLHTFSKLLFLIIFISIENNRQISTWSAYYLLSGLLVLYLILKYIFKKYDYLKDQDGNWIVDFWDGVKFSIGISSYQINNDIDKTMMAKLDSSDATGIYSAGYKVIELLYLPIRALYYSIFIEYFKKGDKGIAATLSFGLNISRYLLGYGIISIIIILLLSDYLPIILGENYSESSTVLSMLCFLPLLRGLNNNAGDVITGCNRQGLRSSILISGSIINIFTNLVLIPRYSYKGAIIATYFTEIFILITLISIIFVISRREKANETYI